MRRVRTAAVAPAGLSSAGGAVEARGTGSPSPGRVIGKPCAGPPRASARHVLLGPPSWPLGSSSARFAGYGRDGSDGPAFPPERPSAVERHPGFRGEPADEIAVAHEDADRVRHVQAL